MGGRMKFEEALEILYKGIAPNPTANNECIKLCKKALEKQIPKKPKVIFGEYSYFECGNCGEAIYCSDELKSHRYCLNCGQAICWDSEVGEN